MHHILKIFLVIYLFTFHLSAAGKEEAVQKVNEAWQYWDENRLDLVEQSFKAALKLDSTNARASFGLSYLYQLQHKYLDSWLQFSRATNNTQNPDPYTISAILTPKWVNSIEQKSSGILDLLHSLSKDEKIEGYTRAMADERLGEYYQSHNNLQKARQHFDAIQAIDDWMVIGPFDNISASGFDNVFPPESRFEPNQEIEGKNGIPVSWFPLHELRLDHWIDFQRYFAEKNAIFYGNTFIYSPEKQTAQIRVGTSGSLKIYLNDEMLFAYFDENNNDLDTYIVESELQKGWNRLLIKCGYSELNRCNFLVRITDRNGVPLSNSKISSNLQNYKEKPAAPVTIITNFAEKYFQKQIEKFPQHIENYLLLADCYLKNDKAIEAELVLHKALAISPNSTLIYNHLLEAYLRGEKYDEISTTYEKIFLLDPDLPVSLDYKFGQYLNNDDFENAEEILNKLQTLLPESADTYQYLLQYYTAKNIEEKVIELSHEGYEKYPDDWQLVTTEMTLSYVKTKSYEQPIKILEDYTSNNTTGLGLSTLANVYLKAGDIKKWEETFQKLLSFYPASTGYYYQMAETYISMQAYDKATEYLNKTIAICPGSPLYWFKLGEVKRAVKEDEEARKCFEKALILKPAYYEARDNLRELQNKKSIFSHFPEPEINKLIASAPTHDKYPEDNAVYLVNDLHRVVYSHGASESEQEILIRLFNGEGIDDLHEYWISYNPSTENLIIEKAVVIKPDRSEIKADINNNQLVFKSLEDNDFIYIKYKLRNYYSGKLSNHFWDEYLFTQFYPVEINRYALLVPDKFKFRYKTQFMSKEPSSVSETEDGILYIWEQNNQAGIEGEYGMPALVDIGKMLFVSSIEDWSYIVNWYLDLAKTKTRSSYEVQEKVSEIMDGQTNLTDLEKVKRIYNFITDNIRYSSVSFRQSGLIPQKARDVLINKIGDCKDVATLCIAMLNELHIKAYYVLVNTRNEGLNKNILPSIAFNHAIVAVELKKSMLYLDLTAQNYPVGSVPNMDVDAFSLLIKPGTTKPFYLSADNFKRSAIKRRSKIIITDDDGLRNTIETTRTYKLAAGFRNKYRFKGKNEQNKALIEVLSNEYPNVRLENFEIMNLDSNDPQLNYRYTFTAPDFISSAGNFKIMRIPWTDNEETMKALSYDRRTFPYMITTGIDTLKEDLSIKLPADLIPVEIPEAVNLKCHNAEYSMQLTYKNGFIQGTRRMIYKDPEISPENYESFKAFFNQVVKTDAQQILLKAK